MTIATLLLALIALPAGNGDEPSGAGGPIVLDFTATWCGPCRQMRPAVEELIKNGYPVKPVDIDQSPELAERYQVTGVPTFVVVDRATGRDLGRVSGARPASDIADLYNQARSKLTARPRAESPEAEAEAEVDEERRTASEEKPNPDPWETVVRIKIHDRGSKIFGSGTVVSSTPKETLILTCAHIFKKEGTKNVLPSRFPRRITVDLFDGKLRGVRPAQVHYANETYEGEAVDYDFAHDVGLIRIRPGRRLPYAKVVPPHWSPRARMEMITVGCSEGHDATAWKAQIVNPKTRMGTSSGAYEAIECTHAPKEGRSGGGLFTSDGYVAGVCDFAEPRGDHGLYATPNSIYALLDRNKLVGLYDPSQAPGRTETLVADRDTGRQREPRMQSPEPGTPGFVSLPPHEMFGIKTPAVPASNRRLAENSGRRQTWHAGTTDLKLDPSLDPDRFDNGRPAPSPASVSAEPEVAPPTGRPGLEDTPAPTKPARPAAPAGKWRVSRDPLPELQTPSLVKAGAN